MVASSAWRCALTRAYRATRRVSSMMLSRWGDRGRRLVGTTGAGGPRPRGAGGPRPQLFIGQDPELFFEACSDVDTMERPRFRPAFALQDPPRGRKGAAPC